MALIKCPECSKEISDKVKSCPNCGFPVSQESTETQKVEIASVNLKMEQNKKKKLTKVIGSVLAIALIIFIGYLPYSKQQDEKYVSNINLLMTDTLKSGAEAEKLMSLTSQVWYNTIYKKMDTATDKYTKNNGYWNSDFNVSLDYIFKDSSTKSKIANIKSAEDMASEVMKKLQNPPKKYVKIYDTLLELHSAYEGTINLAISPEGNLSSFNNSKNEKTGKFTELYKKLQTQLPNSN